jgi:hypothetical protein
MRRRLGVRPSGQVNRAPFRIIGPAELREAARALGRRLAEAADTLDPAETFD